MHSLTVAITTYNRWPKCEIAFDSIVNQSRPPNEIVIVDDFSIDEIPPNFLAKVIASGASLIRHQENRGLAAARNTALQVARSEYFAFCDDDDQWLPNAAADLMLPIKLGSSNPQMVIAIASRRKRPQNSEHKESLQNLILAGVTPPVGSQLYLTKMLRGVGGYDVRVKSGVDHDLWVSLATTNPLVTVVNRQCAIVGRNLRDRRMTTVEEIRRSQIDKSLSIWESKIVDTFGSDFYLHFRTTYRVHLDVSFTLQDIRRRRWQSAARRCLKNPSVVFRISKIAIEILTRSKRINSMRPFMVVPQRSSSRP